MRIDFCITQSHTPLCSAPSALRLLQYEDLDSCQTALAVATSSATLSTGVDRTRLFILALFDHFLCY